MPHRELPKTMPRYTMAGSCWGRGDLGDGIWRFVWAVGRAYSPCRKKGSPKLRLNSALYNIRVWRQLYVPDRVRKSEARNAMCKIAILHGTWHGTLEGGKLSSKLPQAFVGVQYYLYCTERGTLLVGPTSAFLVPLFPAM